MSRRKQAKPRALKHEGDEEESAAGTVLTGRTNKRTVAEALAEGKSDSPMEDISDDDREEDEGLDEASEEGLASEVAPGACGLNRARSLREFSRESASDQLVNPCGEIPGDGSQQVCANVSRSNRSENFVVTNPSDCVTGSSEYEAQAADDTTKCEPQLRNESMHSRERSSGVVNDSAEEGNIDDDDDSAEDDEDDLNDDGDDLDIDDDEEDDLPVGAEADDVDDELTSDSFCSELYSSHTSSSFSPSISDGMTTPNSITNDTTDGSLLALESAGEKSYRHQHHLHHHHHPHHVGRYQQHHHVQQRRAAGHSKEPGKSSSKGHPHSTNNNTNNNNNNNNSSSHNHNDNHSTSGKGLTSTYQCQFCEKTFPRLGYLKKHEQSHTEHMPFKCEYCARLFKHKRSRDRHTKLHTGDRRYRCLHCEAAFSRSDHLKIHMKTHDNQKPFQCTICNRGYNTAAALTSHMQNHKKQLALTGSPNLTYSPRSTTSSLSSGGGGSTSGGKRASKFSPYGSNDPLLLMGRSSKLAALAKGGSSGGGSSVTAAQRTPTPGSAGGGLAGGGGAAGPQQELLACPYCTRTDFASLEQLGLHVQSMHGHGALGMLAADTPLPYFAPHLRTGGGAVGRRAVTPDATTLSLGPYPPIPCEFCTMKFPTVPLMFAHLKASHLDRLASGGGGVRHRRGSPSESGGSPSATVGSRPPASGYHPLDQLHFNKSLLGSTFSTFYGGAFGGGATTSSGGSIKTEHRSAGLAGRDENGNEPDEPTVKRRRGEDASVEADHPGERYRDGDPQEAMSPEQDNGREDVGGAGVAHDSNAPDHADDGNYDEEELLADANEEEETSHNQSMEGSERGRIKQEDHDEPDRGNAGSTSHSSSARSSPCESLASSVHPPGSASGRDSPAEQLTPTDLSQPKMKRLKLEALDEDDHEDVGRRPHGREHPQHRGQRGHRGRESESQQGPSLLASLQQHHHNQHHAAAATSSAANAQSTGTHSHVSQATPLPPSHAPTIASVAPPGAYLCNQCNAALPDFESFRTHLKAHLEQSAASAAAAMRHGGEPSASAGSNVPVGALSLSAFLCQQCGATLGCQAEYEQHTIGHYLITVVEYRCQAAAASSGACCATSGKASFGKVEELHKHLYEAHMQLLYKCTVCGETFDSKVQVQVHFAVSHSPEVKLYRCSACADVFRTERDFRQHIRNRHLTAGAVQCMFCRMVCSSELEMHFHLASHARKFKCPACPESFHVEFLLDRHIQTQHSQKETTAEAPGRRECNQPMVGTAVPSSTANGSGMGPTSVGSANVTSSSANSVTSTTSTAPPPASAASSLEYLQLHGQMAAMAAAAAAASTGWPSLYQTANKFYTANPLHVDTLSQLKHPQHLLHGFYDTMLGKTQQQQQQQPSQHRATFVAESGAPGPGAGNSKKNPFLSLSPNSGNAAKVANSLLGLGYGGTAGTGQSQRPAAAGTVNGTMSGLYSPESGGNNATTHATPAGSKLYSPIAMIQRYGENGTLPTGAGNGDRVGSTASDVETTSAAHAPGGSSEQPPEQPGRKPNAPSSGKGPERSSVVSDGVGAASGAGPSASGSASCGYSCGICERADFSTESEVQTHRKIVHNLKTGVSLRCAYCNGDFRSRNELENHMKIAHNTGGGKHKCLICDEIFPSPAVLAEHKLSHCKVGASGRCSHCSLPLPDAHTFKQHLPVHQPTASSGGGAVSTGSTTGSAAGAVSAAGSGAGNTGGSATTTNANGPGTVQATSGPAEQDRFPQQCICCRQTLNSEFEISLHAKFHTKSPDTNERTCALCLEPLPSQPETATKICDPCLKRHNFPTKLLSMNFLKPSSSSVVAGSTASATGGHSSQLSSHATSALHGVGSNGPSNGTATETPRQISREGQQQLPFEPTASGAVVREGVATATSSSPSSIVQCNLCKKSLVSAQKLQEHLIDHTFAGCEERGYVCYLCSAVFTSSAGLQTHLPLAHSNATAKPYDCERCGVAYFFRAELEHHLIEHELSPSGTVRRACDGWRPAVDRIKQEHSEEDQEYGSPTNTPSVKDREACFPERDSRMEEDHSGEGDFPHLQANGDDKCLSDDNNQEDELEEEDGGHDANNGNGTVLQAAADVPQTEPNPLEQECDEDDGDENDLDEDEDEEYIEVEHTMGMDERNKPSDHHERASAKLLLNGENECIGISSSASSGLPAVTAAE